MSKRERVKFVLYSRRYGLAYTALILISAIVLLWRLEDLVPGIAAAEAEYGLGSAWSALLSSPFEFIHRLLQAASTALAGSTPLGLRLPSVLIGGLFLATLFATISVWHRRRIAIVATGLAATSSWFLHAARLGNDTIMYPMAALAIIFLTTAFHHSRQRPWQLLAVVAGLSLTLYTPLSIYMLILFVVLYRQELKNLVKDTSIPMLATAISLGLILAGPLIYSFIGNLDNLLLWLGLPENVPSPAQMLSNLNATFAYMFWRAGENSLLHVGSLPMLDIFTATMTALGLYHYESHSHHLRTRFLIGGFFTATVMVSLNPDQVRFGWMMPFVFIFAATGVITLLTQWYQIFPRNPVARASAIVPLSLLLMMVSYYHLERYFFAWSYASATVTTFPAESDVLNRNLGKLERPLFIVATPATEPIVQFTVRSSSGVSVATGLPDSESLAEFKTILVSSDISQPLPGLDAWQPTGTLDTESVRRPHVYEIYSPLTAQDGS